MDFSNPLASILLANMGTPLMWAGIFHLAFGNLVIGLVEGLLIAWLFKVPKKGAIPSMIGANYFSAWVGYLGLGSLMESTAVSSITIYNASWYLLVAGIGAYLLTLLLEWPFVAFLFRRHPQGALPSLKACFWAQTASYALLLVPFYFSASGITLLTRTHKDRHYGAWAHSSSWIYYISEDDNLVYRSKLDGSSKAVISEIALKGDGDRLFGSASTPEKWNLYALDSDQGEKERVLIGEGFSGVIAIEDREKRGSEPAVTWFNFGPSADLRGDAASHWRVKTGFWPIEGLSWKNESTGERHRIALEAPFLQWHIRNATVLPGDQIVFQLGRQICILDRETMRIGLIAKGRGPVVALPAAPEY